MNLGNRPSPSSLFFSLSSSRLISPDARGAMRRAGQQTSAQQAHDLLVNARRQLDQADTVRAWIAEGTAKDTEDAQSREQLGKWREYLEQTLHIKGVDVSDAELQDSRRVQWSSARARNNATRNRWANVWPWDHSMLPGSYLNASTIPRLPSSLLPVATSQSYVATQSPVPNTFVDFYRHLYASHATLLVNLTPQWDVVGEQRMRKGHRYWPPVESGQEVSSVMQLGEGWSVQVVEHSTDTTLLGHMQAREFDQGKDWRIIKRKLRVTPPAGYAEDHKADYEKCLRSVAADASRPEELPPLRQQGDGKDKSRIIEMIHVEHWSDGGDAAVDNFARLVELVVEHQRRQQREQTASSHTATSQGAWIAPPIWVHCSAGIGRTGTLIGALMARDILLGRDQDDGCDKGGEAAQHRTRLANDLSSVELTVRIWSHMRTRRSGLITTADQAMMVWGEIERLKQGSKGQ
ncbi:unnamed protein product [Parajaminaea phylloscopi]